MLLNSFKHLAKNGLKANQVELTVPISKAETKSLTWGRFKKQWQKLWEKDTKGRHLRKIQQEVREGRLGLDRDILNKFNSTLH